jgi:hypothetical protein
MGRAEAPAIRAAAIVFDTNFISIYLIGSDRFAYI